MKTIFSILLSLVLIAVIFGLGYFTAWKQVDKMISDELDENPIS